MLVKECAGVVGETKFQGEGLGAARTEFKVLNWKATLWGMGGGIVIAP